MTNKRVFVFLAGMALFFAILPLQGQNDRYGHVRFTNESEQPAKLKVWNSRVSGVQFEATVEIGKSIDLKSKDGTPILIALRSSVIQVNDKPEKQVTTVASRKGDIYVVVWTKNGFKINAK